MKAAEIMIQLRLVDYVSKPLRRLAWKLQSADGQWHPSYMKADQLYQTYRTPR